MFLVDIAQRNEWSMSGVGETRRRTKVKNFTWLDVCLRLLYRSMMKLIKAIARLCARRLYRPCMSKVWHSNTLCTWIYDHNQNASQKSSARNSASQRTSTVAKGPVSQESTRQINTTIDGNVVCGNLQNSTRKFMGTVCLLLYLEALVKLKYAREYHANTHCTVIRNCSQSWSK